MPLDFNRCGAGYYWIRYKDRKQRRKPWIVECRQGGTWWEIGWDIPINKDKFADTYEILGYVEPWNGNGKK